MHTEFNKVKKIAEEVGGRVMEYSGRGMYSEYCAAVSCDDAKDCLYTSGKFGLRGGLVDSLGLGFVVYWPGVAFVEENVSAD